MTRPVSLDRPDGGAPARAQAFVATFVADVYRWMGLGLALTALSAWWAARTPAVVGALTTNPGLLLGLMLVELALVVGLSAALGRLSPAAAIAGFLIYSVLNGVTLSLVLLLYTATSVTEVFVITAGMFGAAAIYGTRTGRDLSSWRGFLFMGLIGVLLAAVVNLWLRSPAVSWVLSAAGVVVFVGLAAYDSQRLRHLALQATDRERRRKLAIIGALALYLDFVNLFLMLLRLLGDRRS